MAKIEAIIFDCDGVLVDSEIIGLHETAAYLRRHGFGWSAADLVREFTGMHMDSLKQIFNAEYERLLGRIPTEEETTALYDGFINERRKRRHLMTVVPGTVEMAQSLKHLSLEVSVASSSQTHFLEDKMKRYDLWDMFAPHIYSADLVSVGKPAPDIFLYTAERMGIDPDKCLVIEDSAHGVTAGVAAGMTVWGFIGGGHCFDGHEEGLQKAGASIIATDHQDLTAKIATL